MKPLNLAFPIIMLGFAVSAALPPEYRGKLPVDTGSMHKWNRAEVGTITFPEAGPQLLTFEYNAGNNFAYFEFEPMDK